MKIKMKLSFLKSLRFRVMVLLVIIGILPCIIAESVIVSSYENRAVELKNISVKNQCDILGKQLMKEEYLKYPQSEVINSELAMFSSVFSGRILVINRDGRIVKDTYDMNEGKYVLSEAVIKCFEGENTGYYDKDNSYIVQTVPLKNMINKQVEGVMLISISTSDIKDSIAILRHRANLLLLIICVFVLILGFVWSKTLVRPFARVGKAIEELTDGYLDEEISVPDYTETEMISSVFNKMLKKMKVLDDSRQEFVANVSHELKTPMTSIKVLSDSLLAQENVPAELYREFMEDIASEIDRENQIITDLLALVKMDKKVQDLNIVSLNINDLTELILKRLRPIARKKDVEVVFESVRPVVAEVDEVKMTLIMTNLVENAIKYNKDHGWVKVILDADHQYFTFEVSDSGIGIPEEALAHICERFYRVDKSHSREIGGTGLGLAITKSAVLMHKGSLTVTSTEGQGSCFLAKIPLTYIAS